jgi:large subunit ribosomal protein L15
MPIQRRLPKRGFKNYPFKKEYAIVNLKDLSGLDDFDVITTELMIERGIVKDLRDGVKVLGVGEVSRPLTIRAVAFSKSAREKVANAGGRTEVI